MSGGDCAMMVGRPTGRYKASTLVVVTRSPRSKWWKVACFGQRGHYRKDGTCPHTDALVASLNPKIAPPERVRVTGWGDDPPPVLYREGAGR